MNTILFRKQGGFYHVYDDDCYILYYLFDYKITNNMVGFPIKSLNKVIAKLENLKINFEVLNEDNKKCFKNLNTYTKYVNLGKEKYSKELKYQDLYNKINKLTEEDLDKILDFVGNLIYE